MKLKVSYGYNGFKIRIHFSVGNLQISTAQDTWLAKMARKVLLDGKTCEIDNSTYLTFEADESSEEFMRFARELTSLEHRIWKKAYEKLESGTPLEEIMQDIAAHTLGSVLSKDLEEINGRHNLRRENDLRTLQPHTTEVKGHIRF